VYEATDWLIYKLTSASGESTSYGVVRVTVDRNQDEQQIKLKIPQGRGLLSMFFVDENTGFIGGDGIYKTIDAGVTWNSLINSQPSQNPLVIVSYPSEKSSLYPVIRTNNKIYAL